MNAGSARPGPRPSYGRCGAAASGSRGGEVGVARGNASPEQLRRGGADAVVADLPELLRPT
jgi:hypothetical protein